MKRLLVKGLLLIVVPMLAGCGVSTPTRFYSLSILSAPAQKTQDAQTLIVAVGPIDIPAYLDRSQIISRLSANELDLQEFHQWAEPLRDALSRVLAENLTSLLASDGVQVEAWQGAVLSSAYRITVQVVSFDDSLADQVDLVARWEVVCDSGKTVVSRRSQISKKVRGSDVEALVAAHSAALEELSKQMALEVRGLRR